MVPELVDDRGGHRSGRHGFQVLIKEWHYAVEPRQFEHLWPLYLLLEQALHPFACLGIHKGPRAAEEQLSFGPQISCESRTWCFHFLHSLLEIKIRQTYIDLTFFLQ